MVPRFRAIDAGLPGGLNRDELLAQIDSQGKSKWRFGWFTYGESNSRSVGVGIRDGGETELYICLLYTSPSPRDKTVSRMPSSA